MIRCLKCNSETLNDVLIADTFISRFFGFMFRKTPHHQAILIKPCNSIHTYFMKFSIDVIFLNKDMKIIKSIYSLGPKKVIFPVKEAHMVIEGKVGTFEGFKLGDKVILD